MVPCFPPPHLSFQAASERSRAPDEYVITLSRSLVEPFLTTSDRRDLRETAWRAWTQRGEMDAARDNRVVAKQVREGCDGYEEGVEIGVGGNNHYLWERHLQIRLMVLQLKWMSLI